MQGHENKYPRSETDLDLFSFMISEYLGAEGFHRNLNATQALAHSSDDLRNSHKSSKTLKMPKMPNIMKKRNSTNYNSANYNNSSGSENGYDQNGVLRISTPFLNNPLVQHVN